MSTQHASKEWSPRSEKITFQAWGMLIFPLLFFSYQLILRTWPSHVQAEDMLRMGIDAKTYGWINGAYYFGYAGMQIPTAIFLDRYNPRKVLFFLMALTGIAMAIYVATSFWPLALGARFFVGLGSSAGLLGLSRSISLWVPAKRYSQMLGFLASLGLAGYLLGGKPLGMILSWASNDSHVGMALAIGAILLAFGNLFIFKVPQHVLENSKEEASFGFKDIVALLRSWNLWLLGVVSLLMVGPLEGFADLWGLTYLIQAYGLSKQDAAFFCSLIFLGLIAGVSLIPFLAEKIGHGLATILCGLGIGLSLLLTLFVPLPLTILGGLLTLVGILSGYQINLFFISRSFVPKPLAEMAIAMLNSVNMFGGTFFHGVIGAFVGLFSKPSLPLLWTYRYALLVVPVCALLGAFLFWIWMILRRYLLNTDDHSFE